VHPAAADHRRDDLYLAELVGGDRDRVAVEHDEIGEEPWQELPAPALVAGEPGGRDRRRVQRLLDRVHAGELATAPGADLGDSVRASWL